MNIIVTKVVRTHDKLYLKEDRKSEPKEYFEFILSYAKYYLDALDSMNVVDIGCATGDFLYYFDTVYPNNKLCGIDVMESLLEKAEKEFPKPNYMIGNIESGDGLPNEEFDAVFMSGVAGIFDDMRPVLNNIKSIIKKGGRSYIFGIFNPENLDVVIRSKKSCTDGAWETGWNIHSLKTVESIARDCGMDINYKEFNITIDIPKNGNDPLRSWTLDMKDDRKMIINGLQIVHRFYLLELIK